MDAPAIAEPANAAVLVRSRVLQNLEVFLGHPANIIQILGAVSSAS
jgi:hypothetical protein